ncbi:ABC transporter membrane protein [Streptococcus pneumoniae]|nr:ABC transporter membrane protein [Streptococcus pneumoniae]
MRLKVIKKLVDINILYSSQEANLANLRKKQAKNPGKKVNVSARVLSSYIFSSLLMLICFSNIAIHFPFEECLFILARWLLFYWCWPFQLLSLPFTMYFMRVRTWPPIGPMPLKNQRL